MLNNMNKLIEKWGESAAVVKENGATSMLIDIESFAELLQYFEQKTEDIKKCDAVFRKLSELPSNMPTTLMYLEEMLSSIKNHVSNRDEITIDKSLYLINCLSDLVLNDDNYNLEIPEYEDVPASSFRTIRVVNETDEPEEQVAQPEPKKNWLDRLFRR